MRADDRPRRRRDEDDGPGALARKFDQPHFPERCARLRESGLENLLHALVDRAHDRHARKNRLAETYEAAASEIGGEKPEESKAKKDEDAAEAGNAKRQIGVRQNVLRHEAADPAVDGVDEPP